MNSNNNFSHKKELKKRLIQKRKQIIKQEKLVYQELDTSDPNWIDEYKKLNLLRLDLKTIKSRQENIGRQNSGIPAYHIESKHLK